MSGKLRRIETLTSKIVKILRITNEPLSANAISKTYNFPYNDVQGILIKLEEDGVLTSLKTKGGLFYFIPNKYFKRNVTLDSDENIPFVWLEDLTNEELSFRKKKLLDDLQSLKEQFTMKIITGKEFFQVSQKKNEELLLINQVIEERKTKSKKKCYHCGTLIENIDEKKCSNCGKEYIECIVCKQTIYFEESVMKCPNCQKKAHMIHLHEWIKAYGHCPKCNKKILEKGD